MPVDPGDYLAPYRVVGQLARQSAARWMTEMLDSDDLRTRAAGLAFRGRISDGVTSQPFDGRDRDELVQLAVGARDPAVYRMAMWACGVSAEEPSGACSRLSVEQWASMDPDNAIPWLAIAAQARSRGDAAGEEIAFSRAAGAHRSDDYLDTVFRTAEAALPPDVTALERVFFSIEVGGVTAAMAPPYGIVSRHCSPEALADDGVQSQCLALADVMTEHSNDLVGAAIGSSLGARLGRPANLVAARARHFKALKQAMVQSGPTGADDQWTCRTVELTNALTSQRVRLGEIAALEDALERSGETEDEMAKRWDDTMKGWTEEAVR